MRTGPGMRVAYPSGSRLCHRLQRIPLGTLDAQVAARELPRGQPERDRGAERGECRRYRKRYRTILTQGGKELPEIPQRRGGKRGRIAKSDAHNLHEALLKLGDYSDTLTRIIHEELKKGNNAL